jgi:ABC-type glycerol-3-phosphate transport system substrate-binding protein
MRYSRFVRTCAIALALLLASAGAFAEGTKEKAAPTGPVSLKVFRGGVTIDWVKDPVILELNKRLNIKLDFITANWSEVGQKVSLIMAAGDEIDVVHHLGDLKWITEGTLVPLDQYLDKAKTPYLYRLVNSTTFMPNKYEGKAYYVPMIAHGPDYGLGVRQDWMEKLGLAMPRNEAEFKAAIKAMKNLDPSGQTTGYQMEGASQIRRTTIPIMTAFGIPTSPWDQVVNFKVENGKLMHITQMPAMKAALKYLNGLFLEGLINSDFPTMDSYPKVFEKYFKAGKGVSGWIQNPLQAEPSIQKIDPAAKVGVIPQFSATGYSFTRATGLVVNGQIGVSAKSKNPAKAVEFLEYVNSEEGRQLLNAGVKGVHYGSFDADGYFDRIDAAWKKDYGESNDYQLYFYFGQGLVHGYIPAARYNTFEEAYANIKLYDPVSLKTSRTSFHAFIPVATAWVGAPNPFQFVIYPELNDIRVELNNSIITGWTKCIAAPEGKFDSEYDAWQAGLKKLGLEKWTAAYQKYQDEKLK